MSTPGWYPDPAGQPNRFRFWDGHGWSDQTTDNPQSGAPSASARPSGPGAANGNRRQRINLARIIGVAAFALVIIVAGVFVMRALLPGDQHDPAGPLPSSTVSGWDDSSPIPSDSPTPTPSPTPSRSATPAPQQECPQGDPLFRNDHPTDDRVHGGGLSFASAADAGYKKGTSTAGISWAYDVGEQEKSIEPRWISMFAVGTLRIADGFHEPKQAADAVMQCAASSDFYRGFQSRKDLSARPIKVGNRDGYAIRAEIRVEDPEVKAEGDVVEVLVVDMGSPEALGMFIGTVPIGDATLIKQLDTTVKSLQPS